MSEASVNVAMSKSKVKDRRSDVSVKRSSVSELVGKVSCLIHGDRHCPSVERVRGLAEGIEYVSRYELIIAHAHSPRQHGDSPLL